MTPLREFQEAFAGELLSFTSTSALARQPGFAIYRNTVMAGCVDALAANYPTVQQLVGADCFRELAAAFARQDPPRTGALAKYGEHFASFLTSAEAVSELEYLPSIASLDRFWTEAHFAAEAPVLRASDLAFMTPEALSDTHLTPHPAARWRAFESMPIHTLWRRHREHLPLDDELPWRGEASLVTRPAGTVVWIDIPACAAAFLTSCAAGGTFAEAVDDAAATEPRDSPPTWLPRLVAAGAFSRFAGEGAR